MKTTQPLQGIKVLDLSQLLPGPLATLMMLEAGADVIKVERPGGEDMRRFGSQYNGVSAAYQLLNRGKKIVTLDLKSTAGVVELRRLLSGADVLVEQFRPGVMAKLGLAPEDLLKDFPRLIICSISGYGQFGSRARESGHDLNYVASTGLLAMRSRSLPDAAATPPALIADIAGGSFSAAINILLALRQRDATGAGCCIDIAMTDAMFVFAWEAFAQRLTTGYAENTRFPFSGESPRYRLYPARDGTMIAVAALEDVFWQRFISAAGIDECHARDWDDPAGTLRAVSEKLLARDASEWEPIFRHADCCVTVVKSLDDALRDGHFVSRGISAESHDPAFPHAIPLPISPLFRGEAS